MSDTKEGAEPQGATEAKAPPKPAAVRLTHPHGFIEEETGRHRSWLAGEKIVDPAEIELLIGRGAPVEFVD